MVTLAVAVVLATDVAVMVEVLSTEMSCGATKVTDVAASLVKLPGPDKLHVTPWFLTSCVRVAVIFWLCPALMAGGVDGESVTVIVPLEEHPGKLNAQTKARHSK